MDRLRSAVLEHRRLLAALCTALAVVLVVAAVRQPGDTVAVAVAAEGLPSGHVLAVGDVGAARLPAGAVPENALTDPDDLVGRRVGGPMRSGEVFTDARLLAAGPADGLSDGAVVSTVRLSDPGATQGLRVGDRVDVLAVAARDDGPEASVVAEAVPVAAVVAADATGTATIAVETDRSTALTLARVGLESQLSVVGVSSGTS